MIKYKIKRLKQVTLTQPREGNHQTLLRRDLFHTVLNGLNLLVDTKVARGGDLGNSIGLRDVVFKVQRHEGMFTLHVMKYMLGKLLLDFTVIHSHHYHTFTMTRVPQAKIDHFSCASSIMVGYLELLSNFDNRFMHKFNVYSLLSGWVTLVTQRNYESYAQLVGFMCAYPLSRMIRNPAPPSVEGYEGSPLIFSGKLASYLRQRIICITRPNRKLWFSVLQLKRCALKMPSSFVYGALKKHQLLISTPIHPDLQPPREYVDNFKNKLDELLNILKVENFSNFSKIHQFSSSSCYEGGRSSGGAIRAMHERLIVNDPNDKFEGLKDSLSYSPQTCRCDHCSTLKNPSKFETHFTARNTFQSFGEVELYQMRYTPLQGVKQFHMQSNYSNKDVFTILEGRVGDRFDSIPASHLEAPIPCYDGISMVNHPAQCNAKVAAVEEPLKIRTVTSGNCLNYQLSIGLQKDLHKSLKRLPQFSLIGEEFNSEQISWLFNKDNVLSSRFDTKKALIKYNNDHAFVSGDYKGATDTLNINLSKIVIEKIIFRGQVFHGWTNRYCNLIRSAIYEHLLSYPRLRDDKGEKLPEIEPVHQGNGQLMGSVLSFPLLCIINLIHYWITVKDRDKFCDLPVLVNGDDILFYASKIEYDNWASTLWKPGFKMSQGKNYYSNKLFTINTRMFSVNQRHNFRPFEDKCWQLAYHHEDYFNVGKLLGKSKVENPYHPQFKPIWALQPDVINGAFDKALAWSRFNYYHQDRLRKITKNGKYNYYISAYLGGLGMCLPEEVKIFTDRKLYNSYQGYKTFITPQQHRLANFMYYYKRDWYYEPFKSAKYGVRNDSDRFILNHSLKEGSMSPFSESFEPDMYTRICLKEQPSNYDEIDFVSSDEERTNNLFYSRGADYDEGSYTFYDSNIPKNTWYYKKYNSIPLEDPAFLCRASFKKVVRLNHFLVRSMTFLQMVNYFYIVGLEDPWGLIEIMKRIVFECSRFEFSNYIYIAQDLLDNCDGADFYSNNVGDFPRCWSLFCENLLSNYKEGFLY